jgi:hypothetical protein
MSRVFTTLVAYREDDSGAIDPCLLEPIQGIGQWGGESPNDGRTAWRSNSGEPWQLLDTEHAKSQLELEMTIAADFRQQESSR